MIKLSYSQRVPYLTRLKAVVEDTSVIAASIAKKLLQDIDRNIVNQGIWDKWAPIKNSTQYARWSKGKDPRPLFGLRGRFTASFGKTQLTIRSTSDYAALMQEGPGKRSWTIAPKNKDFLSFLHPDGIPWERGGKTAVPGMWVLAKKVTHRGWDKRRIMPPADEVGSTARTIVEKAIKEAIR